jgi:hypothetical protein
LKREASGLDPEAVHIDIVYGLAFAVGFAYLLLVGLNALVVAFQGGLIVGYFLRVWENMVVYERVIEEAVSAEAVTAVAEEVEKQVPIELDDRVPDEVEDELVARLREVDEEVATELRRTLSERDG